MLLEVSFLQNVIFIIQMYLTFESNENHNAVLGYE